MITKKKKIKKKKFKAKNLNKVLSLLFSLFLIVGIVYLIGKNFEMFQKRMVLERKVQELRKEVKELEKQKVSLQSMIQETQKGSFIEKEARDKLNLQKKGEKAVVIEGLEEKQAGEKSEGEKGLWERLRVKFFK